MSSGDEDKGRPWLILQTLSCRDGKLLACSLTDKFDEHGNLKSERCGDVPVYALGGNVKKDSLVRLGSLQQIRESEIEEYLSSLSPGELLMVDRELKNLLFGFGTESFFSESEKKAESSKLKHPVMSKPTPEPFPGISQEPIRRLPPQPHPLKRKKAKNKA